MKQTGPSLFPYVFDASSLIKIERENRMDDLRRRHADVLIPEKVAEEVSRIPGKPLRRFVRGYPQVVSKFEPDEAIEYLKILRQQGMDEGESAAIAIAAHRHLPVVIEEKRGRAKAAEYGVGCFRWEQFLAGEY